MLKLAERFLFTLTRQDYNMELMCDFPIRIKNPHFGTPLANSLDYRYIDVPCGKCIRCINRRTNTWWIRLSHELKSATTAHFVTLTYNDESLTRSYNGLLTCVKSDLQKYFKRLRKREKNNGIKYYAVSEYGGKNHRPHYHAIVFNVVIEANFARAWRINDYPLGNVHVGTVSDESIKYVTGYTGKRIGIPFTDYDDRLPEFSLMSKGLGLKQFIKDSYYYKDNMKGHTIINGYTYPLPRYYKEKLFNKNELKKISNENYLAHLKNQDRKRKNYASDLSFEKAQLELAEISNRDNKNFVNLRKLQI